jgi:hypothetical protein
VRHCMHDPAVIFPVKCTPESPKESFALYPDRKSMLRSFARNSRSPRRANFSCRKAGSSFQESATATSSAVISLPLAAVPLCMKQV